MKIPIEVWSEKKKSDLESRDTFVMNCLKAGIPIPDMGELRWSEGIPYIVEVIERIERDVHSTQNS